MDFDTSNPRAIKAFFKEYEHLRCLEMAQIARVSLRTITYWRKKLGINRKQQKFFKPHPKKPRNQPLDEKIWRNEEWFRQKYEIEGLGKDRIARLISRNRSIVHMLLKRFNIKRREWTKPASSNPCCTEEWVRYHYEALGYSEGKCAELAGVNRYTFKTWLAKYDIVPRTRAEIAQWASSRN